MAGSLAIHLAAALAIAGAWRLAAPAVFRTAAPDRTARIVVSEEAPRILPPELPRLTGNGDRPLPPLTAVPALSSPPNVWESPRPHPPARSETSVAAPLASDAPRLEAGLAAGDLGHPLAAAPPTWRHASSSAFESRILAESNLPDVANEPAQGSAQAAPKNISPGDGGGPPVPLHTNTPPPYPIDAQRRGEQGVVRIQLVVSSGGVVVEVSLLQSSGSPLLDRAAIEHVKHQWGFESRNDGDDRVVEQAIRFQLQ